MGEAASLVCIVRTVKPCLVPISKIKAWLAGIKETALQRFERTGNTIAKVKRSVQSNAILARHTHLWVYILTEKNNQSQDLY